jgi:hypothetical protein
MRVALFILPFLLFSGLFAAAQERHKEAIPAGNPPKAILVQLHTGYTRLKRGGRQEFMDQLVKDMKIANERMVLDFEDNFSFCPVYYFVDSNLKYITNGEFFGYLMDAKGQLIDRRVIPDGDTNVFIVHFGYMLPADPETLIAPLSQRVLIASDHKGVMLPPPLNSAMGIDAHRLKTKKFKSEYRYNSKVTDIHYRPRALEYSVLLQRFYGKTARPSKTE